MEVAVAKARARARCPHHGDRVSLSTRFRPSVPSPPRPPRTCGSRRTVDRGDDRARHRARRHHVEVARVDAAHRLAEVAWKRTGEVVAGFGSRIVIEVTNGSPMSASLTVIVSVAEDVLAVEVGDRVLNTPHNGGRHVALRRRRVAVAAIRIESSAIRRPWSRTGAIVIGVRPW